MASGEIRVEAIRRLNDSFRTGDITGGRIVVTRSIQALGARALESILRAVRDFDDFEPENDPWREHDFGALTLEGVQVLWKIDYYDKGVRYASPNPANAAVTTRVLTIMLAQDY